MDEEDTCEVFKKKGVICVCVIFMCMQLILFSSLKLLVFICRYLLSFEKLIITDVVVGICTIRMYSTEYVHRYVCIYRKIMIYV